MFLYTEIFARKIIFFLLFWNYLVSYQDQESQPSDNYFFNKINLDDFQILRTFSNYRTKFQVSKFSRYFSMKFLANLHFHIKSFLHKIPDLFNLEFAKLSWLWYSVNHIIFRKSHKTLYAESKRDLFSFIFLSKIITWWLKHVL